MGSPRGKRRKSGKSGAPALKTIKMMEEEKNLVPVTVKLGLTTANFVRKHGGSRWIRRAIFKRLKKET